MNPVYLYIFTPYTWLKIIVKLRRFEWISLPSTQKLTFVWVTNFVLFTFVPHFFLPKYTQFFIRGVLQSFRSVINLSQLYCKQIYAHKKLSLEYKVYLVKMNRKERDMFVHWQIVDGNVLKETKELLFN